MQTPGDRGSAGSRRLTRSAHDRGGGGGGGGGNGFASRLLLRSMCAYDRGGGGGRGGGDGFAGRLLLRSLCVYRGGGGGRGGGDGFAGRLLLRSLCVHRGGGGGRGGGDGFDLQRKLIRSKKQNRREGKREVKRGRGRGGCQGENSNFHEKERSEKGGREQHGVYTNYTMHQGIHQGGATKDQECFGDQPDGHPWSAPAQLNWSHSSASEKRREGA